MRLESLNKLDAIGSFLPKLDVTIHTRGDDKVRLGDKDVRYDIGMGEGLFIARLCRKTLQIHLFEFQHCSFCVNTIELPLWLLLGTTLMNYYKDQIINKL